MLQRKRIIRWAALTLALLLVIVVAGGYLALRSNWVRQFTLQKIEAAADQSTGGRTQIGSFDFALFPLTLRLKNVVLRGSEAASEPPLLRVDEVMVGVEIRALLHKEVHLRELVIRHPVVSLRVNAQGATNIPQAPPTPGDGSQTHTSVFDLAVRHFVMSQGEVFYNDKKAPMNADLYNLHADIGFSAAARAYAGSLSYDRGQLAYGPYAPMQHSASLEFAASPSEFSLKSAVVKVSSSVLSVKADITNFSDPSVNAGYDLQLHAQDFASMVPGAKPAGDVHASGTIRYQNRNGRPFVSSLAVSGDLESKEVSAAPPQAVIAARSLHAHYVLSDGTLRVSGIQLETLGGRVTGEAEVRSLDATPVSHVQVAIHQISLRVAQESIRQARGAQIRVSGMLDGTVEANWSGSVGNVQVRSDLNVRGGAKSVGDNSAAASVDAAIHASYDGRNGSITLRQSNLRAASLTLTADGEISRRSSLRVHAQADDLHQLLLVAASFGSAGRTMPAISGSAGLDATIQGSIQQPQVSGQLRASNLHVQGSEWKTAAFSFAASPSQFSVSNGSLVRADQGRASFAGMVGLHEWSYDAANPIRAELSVHRMPVNELQQLAHVQYPVSGDLSAQLSVSGSQLNPSGSGSAEIDNGIADGEPIHSLKVKTRAENGSITASLDLAIAAGSATVSGSYTPTTKAYVVKVDAPSIVLEKIHKLQASQIKGTISASANGQGTLDNPQISASILAPKLELQGNSVSAIRADLAVQNDRANLTLDSQVAQAQLHARGQVDLTGDYQADASIDSNAISLGPLLSSFSSSVPADFQGQTELHATLKGPLKDRARLEAHLVIPMLNASYQQLQISAGGPIHADYANSTLTLQPAEIRGTDTSLRVEGSIPLAGSATPTLTAQGSIDLGIARIFDPDLHSSGTVTLDVRAAGSPSAPSIRGQVRLQDIAVSTAAVPLGIDKLNGTLNIDNDRVQISGTTAQVGSGEVSIGGTITYRPKLQFTVAMQGRSIRLRYPEGLRTVLDSNLSLSGNMEASSLNGRVLVDSLSFTPDFDLSSFSDQFSSNLAPAQPAFADTVRLNVSLQSKQNLSATSSQVSVEGGLNLNVTGTAANPVITGRTELASGELFYRGNRYQLQRGVVTFADPNLTNPDLNVSVASTIEQYNVTINLRGTLDRLTATYTSDPPLATADVIHLIAFGNTTAESSAQSASQSTDAMVASSVIGTGLTSGAQKLAGFSSLQIDPLLGGSNQNPSARVALQQRVTKNFLFTFSTDVSQPGQEIVQGDYQINKRWSVTVTRDQLGGVTVDGRLHTKF